MRPSFLQRCAAHGKAMLSRMGVYFFFAVMIGLGLLLSVVVVHSGHRVDSVIQPLVNDSVPTLRIISELKTEVTERQVLLNQYFAYGLNHAQFRQKYQQNEQDITRLLQKTNPAWKQHQRYKSILALNENAELVALQLERVMMQEPADLDEARAVLVENAIDTNEFLYQLDMSFVDASKEIERAGQVSLAEVSSMIKLVLAYSLAIVIIAVLVAYYIYARQRAENRLAYAARHDRLTDLLNRNRFEADIAALNQQTHSSILLSIDRFQRVLGGLGYEAGDELIVVVKARLLPIVQQLGGTLYRFEGTHFAAILPLKNPAAPHLADQALLQALNGAVMVSGHELFATLSLGGAIYPQDGGEAVALIRNMNAALEQAQGLGGNTSQWYSQEMNARAVERLALEGELRHAVDRDELRLYFQPQALLSNQQVIGVECLVRWQHQGQLVPPIEFIPLAEESGLIIPIGEWILRTAGQQAKAWQEQGMPLVVAVNISARQFQHPHFLALLRQVLHETQVDPQYIELEITEGVVMQDADHTIALLHQLRALGLMLSIDDFGTGYSSLSYLKRFPLNKLKIDQSFIRHLESNSGDAAIVEAIIRLGHSLGLTVIAEGVETAEHVAILKALGCDELQGYYFSRPLKQSDAQLFLQQKLLHASIN